MTHPSEYEVREALAYAGTRRFFKDTNSRFLVILADALEDTRAELDGVNREWSDTLKMFDGLIDERDALVARVARAVAILERRGYRPSDAELFAALSDVKEEAGMSNQTTNRRDKA